jgi:hypothetical protein
MLQREIHLRIRIVRCAVAYQRYPAEAVRTISLSYHCDLATKKDAGESFVAIQLLLRTLEPFVVPRTQKACHSSRTQHLDFLHE